MLCKRSFTDRKKIIAYFYQNKEMVFYLRKIFVLLFIILSFAVRETVSETVDILLQRASSGDYLENAWLAFCGQYTGMVWNDEEGLCKCSVSPKLNFVSFGNRPIGCYEGNEDNCKLWSVFVVFIFKEISN